jgi:ABC-type sugar transport system substrate-binding protein
MNVLKKYPNVHVLENVNGQYTSSGGLAAVSSVLARYGPGQVNWILSEADNMVQGAFGAIESAHRQGTVHFVGINGSNSAMDDLGKDGFDATVVYPVVEPEALVAAAKACNSESMPTKISLEAPLVTTQNVAGFKGTNY